MASSFASAFSNLKKSETYEAVQSEILKSIDDTEKQDSKPSTSGDTSSIIKITGSTGNSVLVNPKQMELENGKSVWKCEICDKSFSSRIYRSRHLKRVHKLNSKGQAIPTTQFPCTLCDKVYAYKNKLRNHMDTIHRPQTKFKCDLCPFETVYNYYLKKHNIRIHQRSDSKKIKCNICNRAYTSKSGLMYHERKKHITNRPESCLKNKKCPLCSFISTKTEGINSHFEKIHDLHIKHEELNFKNLEDFYKWKNEIEIKNKVFFHKRSSFKNICIYLCNRNGNFKSKGQNKRHLKINGTCKINSHCPAKIRVKLDKDGSVTVVYVPTHVGHKNELKFIRLREEDRKNIASQLMSKTSHDAILEAVRNSLTNYELERIHMLNKKDLWNIEKSFNLNTKAERRPLKKSKLVSKLQNLRRKHKLSMPIGSENVLEDGPDKWLVSLSSTTELYVVKRVQQCNTCELQCLHCSSCVHEYICTCIENSKKDNMCVHIHAVARTLRNKEIIKPPNSEDINLIDVNTSQELSLENTITQEFTVESNEEEGKECIHSICKEIMAFACSSTPEEDKVILQKLKEIQATIEAKLNQS